MVIKVTVEEQRCKQRSAGNLKGARKILMRRWEDNIKVVIKVTVEEQRCKQRSAGNLKGARKILTRRWEDNIRMDIKVTVEVVGWIRAWQVAGSSEHSN